MREVQCPRLNPIDQCEWQGIQGKVRDVPAESLLRCASCQLIVHQNNLQNAVNYKEGSMHKWSQGYGGNISAPVLDVQRRLQHLEALSNKKRIARVLDFGCGRGQMISAMSPIFEVTGLEPEWESLNLCREAGFEVYSSVEEIKKTGKKFDLITLFHVFEHFYSPFKELRMIKEILEPDGYLLIETPNSNDALITLFKSESFSNFTFWSHHPMVHSRISLELTLKNAGFRIELSVGHQRYGLANHLFWLSQKSPGGHLEWENLFSQETEKNYEIDLAKVEMSDTLWVVASVCELENYE